jgi:carbonic anhydrase/acetyltransferase-like protein (isoleucine patch superfamily)
VIIPFQDKWPHIHETAFVAPSCDIIGDVNIDQDSSIWFQCVIRGDVNYIRIGKHCNIQDHSMLHVTRHTNPLILQNDITVGHRVLLHGCTVQSRVLIGMGSTLLDGCTIGSDCIIGAGSLVTKNFVAPQGSLIYGSPARVIRPLTDEEKNNILASAQNYVNDSRYYKANLLGPEPHRNRYQNYEFYSMYDE